MPSGRVTSPVVTRPCRSRKITFSRTGSRHRRHCHRHRHTEPVAPPLTHEWGMRGTDVWPEGGSGEAQIWLEVAPGTRASGERSAPNWTGGCAAVHVYLCCCCCCRIVVWEPVHGDRLRQVVRLPCMLIESDLGHPHDGRWQVPGSRVEDGRSGCHQRAFRLKT